MAKIDWENKEFFKKINKLCETCKWECKQSPKVTVVHCPKRKTDRK